MENGQLNTPANMGKRVIFSIVIIAFLVGFILLRQISSNTVFLFDVLVGFLMIAGTFEVEGILNKMGRPTHTVALGLFPIVCFCLLTLSLVYNINYIYYLLMNFGALLLCFIITFIVGILAKRRTLQNMCYNKTESSVVKYSLQRSANTLLGCIYPTFMLVFIFLINHYSNMIPNTLNMDIGLFGIVLLFVTTMLADTCAFGVGRLIKSKKINIQKLGPGKSWSGFVGGIIGAVIGAVLVWLTFKYFGYATLFTTYKLSLWVIIIAGVVAGLFNMCGDMISSYLKRRAGVKDFSDLIPGHGGIMDRINGLIFNGMFIFLFLIIAF